MADYWRKILEKLEKMLDSSDFRVWIEPLTAEIAGHSLVLSMPGASSYYLGRLKKRFEPVIRTAAAEAFSCSRDDVELTFKSVAASSLLQENASAAAVRMTGSNLFFSLPR